MFGVVLGAGPPLPELVANIAIGVLNPIPGVIHELDDHHAVTLPGVAVELGEARVRGVLLVRADGGDGRGSLVVEPRPDQCPVRNGRAEPSPCHQPVRNHLVEASTHRLGRDLDLPVYGQRRRTLLDRQGRVVDGGLEVEGLQDVLALTFSPNRPRSSRGWVAIPVAMTCSAIAAWSPQNGLGLPGNGGCGGGIEAVPSPLEGSDYGECMNRRLNGWGFVTLGAQIRYNAAEKGSPLETVTPRDHVERVPRLR